MIATQSSPNGPPEVFGSSQDFIAYFLNGKHNVLFPFGRPFFCNTKRCFQAPFSNGAVKNGQIKSNTKDPRVYGWAG